MQRRQCISLQVPSWFQPNSIYLGTVARTTERFPLVDPIPSLPLDLSTAHPGSAQKRRHPVSNVKELA